MKILATILSVIGLYLGYWIGKSIYMSFVEGSTSLESIIKAEWIIAGVVCGIICFVNDAIYDTDTEFLGVILVVFTAIAYNIPFSIGFVVFFNLILIGCIITSIWRK